MMDIRLPVLNPDRVIERTFKTTCSYPEWFGRRCFVRRPNSRRAQIRASHRLSDSIQLADGHLSSSVSQGEWL